MRFACDRCKTRYSIADERVRGKILKIRCKACANVITVKEGMEEPAEVAQVPRVTAEVPRLAGESERVHRPTTMAPQATVGSGGVAPPAPVLTAAFTSAMSAPAPSQLEDEWYVSRDGEQQGPFGLRAAQAWVAQQPYDAELYCWCEGFDDWLPVDRIGHFRGLRARPQPPVVPPSAAPPSPAVAARSASEPVAAAGPVGARPVQAGAEASVPAPAAAKAPRMVSGPVATVIGAPPIPAQVAARAPSGPVARAGLGRVAEPELGSASSSGGFSLEEKPSFAASLAALGSPGAPGSPGAFAGGAPGAMAGGNAPAAVLAPAAPLAPAAVLAPAAPLAPAGGAAAREPQPWLGHAAPPSSPNGAAGLAGARGGFDAGDLGSGGFSSDASGSGLRSAQIASSFDDELEFGEVSRVVRIADLNKSAPRPRAQAAAAETAAMAPGWSAPPGPSSVAGFGEGAVVAPLESSGRTEVPVVIPAAQRRNHALLLGLVAIGLIGAGVTALLLLQGSSPEDPMLISTSNRDVRDLTIRPDDPRRPPGAGSQEHAPEAPTRPTPPRKSNGTITTGKSDPPTQPATGKVETTGSSGALTPLGGGEVEEMSQRNSSGLQRCYEQALKKDIFLDVKSIKVTISIDAAGVVNAVQMSSHGDHVLGQCMTSRIRNWRFRPNTRGLDAKFTVAFGRT